MKKPALVDYSVHELIRERWSPRAFADKPVEPDKLRSLLEAARWAPSSYNEQPWVFIVATKEQPEQFEQMLGCLLPGNQVWAKAAAVLMISVAKLRFDRNATHNRTAYHDLGLAAAQLTLQATALGLAVHQMAGIHLDQTRETYGIPKDYDPVAGIAIGYPGDPDTLPEALREMERAPRQRKPLEALVFSGRWGEAAWPR